MVKVAEGKRAPHTPGSCRHSANPKANIFGRAFGDIATYLTYSLLLTTAAYHTKQLVSH